MLSGMVSGSCSMTCLFNFPHTSPGSSSTDQERRTHSSHSGRRSGSSGAAIAEIADTQPARFCGSASSAIAIRSRRTPGSPASINTVMWGRDRVQHETNRLALAPSLAAEGGCDSLLSVVSEFWQGPHVHCRPWTHDHNSRNREKDRADERNHNWVCEGSPVLNGRPTPVSTSTPRRPSHHTSPGLEEARRVTDTSWDLIRVAQGPTFQLIRFHNSGRSVFLLLWRADTVPH